VKIIGTKALIGVAVLSALWAATPAGAIPIPDTVNPTDTTITLGLTPTPCPTGFICTTSALSFVHDITDDGFALVDTIISATVAIHLTEQVVTGTNNETYLYDIGTQTFACISGNCVPNPGVTDNVGFNVGSIADLQADGMITIKVSSTSGSFLFADSVLTAEVTKGDLDPGSVPGPTQIPEPSTLLLLGAGLAAFGWRLRRRS